MKSKFFEVIIIITVIFMALMIISFSRTTHGILFWQRFILQAAGFFFIGILLKKYASRLQLFVGIIFIIGFATFPIIYHLIESTINYTIRWFAELAICVCFLSFGLNFTKINFFWKTSLSVILISSIFLISEIAIPFFNQEIYSRHISIASNNILNRIDSVNSLYTEKERIEVKKQFRGKVLLIEYWFYGCLPCEIKNDAILDIAYHFKDDPRVKIVKVNAGGIDSYKFFKRKFFPEPNILSLHDMNGATNKMLEVNEFPTEFIITAAGDIFSSSSGFTQNETALYKKNTITKIQQLLNEKSN